MHFTILKKLITRFPIAGTIAALIITNSAAKDYNSAYGCYIKVSQPHTCPLDCKKSDSIFFSSADPLATHEESVGLDLDLGLLRWGNGSEKIKYYRTFWFEKMKLTKLSDAG